MKNIQDVGKKNKDVGKKKKRRGKTLDSIGPMFETYDLHTLLVMKWPIYQSKTRFLKLHAKFFSKTYDVNFLKINMRARAIPGM